MLLSKACEHAVRATIYIGQQSSTEGRVSLKEIAMEIDAPEAFTAKILQQLVKKEIISSIQGPKGGFTMYKKSIRQIKLIDIIHTIDGNAFETKCVLGLKLCSELSPCPVHDQFKHIKKDYLNMLQKTNIQKMILGLEDGVSCLKI
ncbi:MAG: Rrf2 family transcriptional regulator [Bacteroidetes bacterium]|nr:Rrf2 family transcriptional regulator [Bacteroidota bacterium]